MARVLVLIGLLMFLSLGAAGFSHVYQDTVTDTQNETLVENETITVTVNQTNPVGNTSTDNVYNESVTVRQDGSIVSSNDGANWQWRTGNGQLFVPEGSAMVNGSANVTYQYREPSAGQRAVKNVGIVPFLFSESIAIMTGFILLLLAVLQMAGTRR